MRRVKSRDCRAERLVIFTPTASPISSRHEATQAVIEDKGPMMKADIFSNELDTELLTLVYEVIEEIGSDPPLLSHQQKAELFSFVYHMNKGTKYTKERLKRFIEAFCTFIEQGIDFDKLSDQKISNIIIQIAQHVVKGGDEDGGGAL
jgi:hypothetical protein